MWHNLSVKKSFVYRMMNDKKQIMEMTKTQRKKKLCVAKKVLCYVVNDCSISYYDLICGRGIFFVAIRFEQIIDKNVLQI